MLRLTWRIKVRIEANCAVALKPCDIQSKVWHPVVIEWATRIRFVRNPKSNPPAVLIADGLDFPSVPRAGQMHESAEAAFRKVNVEIADFVLAEIEILCK